MVDKNKEISKILHVLEESKNYILNGKEIPNDYCRILFPPEKREYELMYYGKESSESIISNIIPVPLQEDRTFPTNTKVKENEWINKLIFGDNLPVLKTLLKMKQDGKLKNSDGSDGVKLIYIDPPFSTRKDFSANGEEQKAYSDKLSGASFLEWLRKRLIVLRELLSDDGAIYVHLDYRKGHYVKVLMDEIFGEKNFRNEIVWCYTGGTDSKTSFGRKHDSIFFYTKSEKYVFNGAYEPFAETTLKRFNKVDENGIYKENKLSDGRITKTYMKEEGKMSPDYWNIPIVNRKYTEYVNYPTQKPEALLERIIEASSREGDIILDCFAGSGTTPIVAEKLNRKWIALDAGKLSIYTIQKRLLNLKDNKTKKKIKYRPFREYFAGLYDEAKLEQFDEENWKLFALQLWGCVPGKKTIKGLTFDGTRNGSMVKVYTPHELKKLKAKISIETLKAIDNTINDAVGSEITIIAPRGQFSFAEDEVELRDRVYHILRIPYSMLAKFTEDFIAPLQPKDAKNINEAVESVGFDFIQAPDVEFDIENGELIIKKFKSNSRIKGEEETELSMVLIDYNYKNDLFDLDEVLFNKEHFKEGKAKIDTKKLKGKNMLIFVDSAGNEKKVIYNG